MSTLTIKTIIPRKGLVEGTAKPTIDVDGAIGTACRDLSASFAKALGGAVQETAKEAMYEQLPDAHVRTSA